jgi:DNA-binding response OmpR family regulator
MSTPQKILIIDDEQYLRRSLSQILKTEGYVVLEASTIKEGIQRLQDSELDLVFLDMKLPDGNGTTVFPQIKSRYPDLPVIILTGHATLETAIEAVRQGARDYLLKPADPELIISRTKAILSEQNIPQKRLELTSQIQALVQELQLYNANVKSPENIPNINSSTDTTRYLKYGSLVLDLQTRNVQVVNKTIPFSSTTFEYLVTLVRHAPNVVDHQTLVRESQGYDLSRVEAIDICRWQIHELRKGLEVDPQKPVCIITERGVGYRLVS